MHVQIDILMKMKKQNFASKFTVFQRESLSLSGKFMYMEHFIPWRLLTEHPRNMEETVQKRMWQHSRTVHIQLIERRSLNSRSKKIQRDYKNNSKWILELHRIVNKQ